MVLRTGGQHVTTHLYIWSCSPQLRQFEPLELIRDVEANFYAAVVADINFQTPLIDLSTYFSDFESWLEKYRGEDGQDSGNETREAKLQRSVSPASALASHDYADNASSILFKKTFEVWFPGRILNKLPQTSRPVSINCHTPLSIPSVVPVLGFT